MSFTDQYLATAMEDELLNSSIMTWDELYSLLLNPEPDNVAHTLTQDQLARFPVYWSALGNWMQGMGGDIGLTKATNVPGRFPSPSPNSVDTQALYGAAFGDVNQTLGTAQFNPTQAISAQLIFAQAFAPEVDVNACAVTPADIGEAASKATVPAVTRAVAPAAASAPYATSEANQVVLALRGGIAVSLLGEPSPDGTRVSVRLSVVSGQAEVNPATEVQLGQAPGSPRQATWHVKPQPASAQAMQVRLELIPVPAQGKAYLWAAYPLSEFKATRHLVAQWALTPVQPRKAP